MHNFNIFILVVSSYLTSAIHSTTALSKSFSGDISIEFTL